MIVWDHPYAAIVSSQYQTQLLARTHVLDWNHILAEVEKEVATVEREGDYPDIRIVNLQEGARLSAETDHRVEVLAMDGDGIQDVKHYLNGLLLKTGGGKDLPMWSGSSDELLKALKP